MLPRRPSPPTRGMPTPSRRNWTQATSSGSPHAAAQSSALVRFMSAARLLPVPVSSPLPTSRPRPRTSGLGDYQPDAVISSSSSGNTEHQITTNIALRKHRISLTLSGVSNSSNSLVHRKHQRLSTSPSPIFPASLRRHEVDPIFDVSSTFPTTNIALTSRLAKHHKFRFDIYYELEIGGDERSKFQNYLKYSPISSKYQHRRCRYFINLTTTFKSLLCMILLSNGFDGFWSKEYWQNWKGHKTKQITKLQTVRRQISKLHNSNNGGKFTFSQSGGSYLIISTCF